MSLHALVDNNNCCCIKVMQYNLKTLQNEDQKTMAEAEPWAPSVCWPSPGPANARRRWEHSSGAPAISSCVFPAQGRKAICLLSYSKDELPVLNQTLLSQCKSIYL